MLTELFNDLTSTFDELRYGTPTRVLTVAKPYCAPARSTITGALEPYGVTIHGYTEQVQQVELQGFLRRMKVELKTWENLKYGPAAPVFLPMAIVAKVRVSTKQAAWAEYLMLRTGKLYVPGRYVNKRNAEWAAKHGGTMPPAWEEGKPMIESGCKSGIDAWQNIRNATKGKRSR